MGPTISPRPAISDATVLYRALRTRKQAEELREAFMLRESERNSGLSVNYGCTGDQCRMKLNKSYGVLGLLVGCVERIGGLRIVVDESAAEYLPHACITGVPHKDDNAAEAERIASKLVECIAEKTIAFWKRE